MSEAAREVPAPSLDDSWERRGPILLDGWLERHGFSPLLLAFAGLVGAFILFQLVISPAATVLLLMAQGVPADELLDGLAAIIDEHARTLLAANTIGQIFGLALPAYVLARLHTRRPAAFVRARRSEGAFVGLSALALIGILPAIQWLGRLNDAIPLPESVRQFEHAQLELIARVLQVDVGIVFNLVVLAVAPAICEELLFRGYVQRQAERGLGVKLGILFSGIVFGLYHLRPSQIIPLTVLGIYLAWLVWRTGSLWPAIVVHFLNNATAVVVGALVARRPDFELADLERLPVPWYVVLVGILVFATSVARIERTAAARLTGQRQGEESEPDDSLD
jgi:uncharacterized protein